MYRYVPFDEIEKNKWNGTVYYSPNGNVYGYYWYLKSVWREWDAIVEDDYESVLPIIPRRVTREEAQLVPDLGPYSVNPLTAARVEAMLKLAEQYNRSSLYPVNSRIVTLPKSYPSQKEATGWLLDTITDIDEIRADYSRDAKTHTSAPLQYKVMSGIKPEILVRAGSLNSVTQNTLLRIIYNAMHRGIGWSSGLLDTKSDSYQAASYFVSTNNKVFEIYAADLKNTKARYQLLDLLAYNSAGKPNQIISHFEPDILENMGFSPFSRHSVQARPTWIQHVKRWIKG